MNKTLPVILIAIGLAVASGVLYFVIRAESGSTSLPAGWEWYHNNQYGYSIGHPGDWEIENRIPNNSENWVFSGEPGYVTKLGFSYFEVLVAPNSIADPNLQEIMASYKGIIESSLGSENVVFLSDEIITTPRDGLRIIYKQLPVPYWNGISKFYVDEFYYQLSWASPDNDDDPYSEVVDTILDSFTIHE